MRSCTRSVLTLAAGVFFSLGGPAPTEAQQPRGTVAGQVLEQATRRPLSGVQVFIPGTGLGGLTNAAGQFVIRNVPTGETTVRAQIIGYATASQKVECAAGQTVVANFSLAQQVLALEEVVVTGTPGQARRREVGNAISQVRMTDVTVAPPAVEQLLQGATPGMSVMESGAQVGSGRAIRLRGNVSVAMSNQPLIYVDGVRIRSDAYPKNQLLTDGAGSGSGPNTVSSPLNDIDPSDIERVEVVKGPAATTLYGTEAAAGVIQIFTKKGRTGRASWTANLDQGFSKMVQSFGTELKPFMGLDRWLSTGLDQRYSLSVSGGQEAQNYFASGSYQNTEGILPDDWQKSYSVRGNFNFRPLSNLHAEWNTSFTNKQIQNVPMGNNAEGLALNVYRLPRNYIGSEDPAVIDRLFEQEWLTDIGHLVTGLTLRHETTEKFSNRLTVGYDRVDSELTGTFPYGFITQPDGMRNNRRWKNETLTFDYVSSLDTKPTENLSANFSLGAQSVTTDESSLTTYTRGFPGPGQPTISSGAVWVGYETRIRVINAGAFGQALLGFKDRYFFTVGLRADGNSAFGSDLGIQLYPKVSGSYVLSDEAFWPESLGTIKLRAAYGHAGRAPGAFDAVRTWRPVGFAGEPAFWPNSVGNSQLGPERSKELEMGFESVLLEQRLSLDFTYYTRRTTDALIAVQQPPTMGFLATQLENVGVLSSHGVELAARATILQGSSLSWELGLTLATNQTKVEDLGGAAAFSLGENGWIKEGYPAPVLMGTYLKNPKDKAAPELEPNHYFGPNLPTHTIGANTVITLPFNVQVSAQAEYLGGHYIYDRASRNMASRGVWAPCQGPGGGYELLAAKQFSDMTAEQRLLCDRNKIPRDFFTYPADFLKLRSVGVRIPLPGAGRLGASNASVSAVLRNIRIWNHADLPLFDPEMAGNSGAASVVRSIVENVPAPQSLAFSLRVTY